MATIAENPKDNTNTSSFDQKLYTLSSLQFQFQKITAPAFGDEIGSGRAARLSLLDSIAKLIVTEKKDAAAVGLFVKSDGFTFLIAKRESMDTAQRNHVENILRVVQNAEKIDVVEMTRDIMKVTVDGCRNRLMSIVRKIESIAYREGYRIKKSEEESEKIDESFYEKLNRYRKVMIDALRSYSPLGLINDVNSSFPKPILVYTKLPSKSLIKQISHAKSHRSMETSLQKYLDRCIGMSSEETYNPEAWVKFLGYCHHIGKSCSQRIVFNNRELGHKLHELWSYVDAALTVAIHVHSRATWRKRHLIRIEEVSHQTVENVVINKSLLDSLNRPKEQKETKEGNINQHTPRHRPSPFGESSLHKPINLSKYVHCELSIAHHMLKSSTRPFEIGISKRGCCSCCQCYMVLLQQSKGLHSSHILVSNWYTKLFTNWQFHDEAPDDVRKRLEEIVTQKLVEMGFIIDSRWVTSNPPPAP